MIGYVIIISPLKELLSRSTLYCHCTVEASTIKYDCIRRLGYKSERGRFSTSILLRECLAHGPIQSLVLTDRK